MDGNRSRLSEALGRLNNLQGSYKFERVYFLFSVDAMLKRDVDRQFLVDSGLYESAEEFAKREGVLSRLKQYQSMTISDRAGALEQEVESNHTELHMGLDTLRNEFQQMHADVMEKFDLVLRTWESQERERKEKGLSQTKSAEPSSNSVEESTYVARLFDICYCGCCCAYINWMV
ncbi:Uncharacterized protein Fot_49767 [Forsythia ovata]|uniref:Uncharacterized protein n=1 Tax=Forsythia ovata TaxID=205694 RepID=A0ABD1QD25_9LAMI